MAGRAKRSVCVGSIHLRIGVASTQRVSRVVQFAHTWVVYASLRRVICEVVERALIDRFVTPEGRCTRYARNMFL